MKPKKGTSRKQAVRYMLEQVTKTVMSGITVGHEPFPKREVIQDYSDLVYSQIAGMHKWSPDIQKGYLSIARDESGKLVGGATLMAAVFPIDKGTYTEFYLETVAVSPDCWGLGIGTALVYDLLLATGNNIISGHCAWTSAEFFSKCGFTVYPPGYEVFHQGKIKGNGEPHPCVIVGRGVRVDER